MKPGKVSGRFGITLFLLCVLLFSLMNYGGLRSPDCEVVFKTAQSLESGHGFAVQGDMEAWKGFGVAPGKDGKRYSVFGPVQPIVCVPLVWAAERINSTGWYKYSPIPVPLSHWVGRTLMMIAGGKRPKDLEPHGLRFIVSFFNSIVSALGVVVFWLIVKRYVSSSLSAAAVSLVYAFGTLTWPYSGTFFSEPLAILFVLLSFYLLDLAGDKIGSSRNAFYCVSGLILGIAVATHLTAILFVPFFGFWAGYKSLGSTKNWKMVSIAAAAFMVGLFAALAPLGYYNYVRFGSFLETGRTVDPRYVNKYLYGIFRAPWRGLYGLTFSSGKGVFYYCPAVIAGLLCWSRFHRRYQVLSLVLLAAIIFRVIFIACRSDWHAGFCVGPRYLLMVIPFILIPTAVWLDDQIKSGHLRRIRIFLLFGAACAAQQIYFCMGEVFSYLHFVRWLAWVEKGINLIDDDRLFLNWSDSPLFYLLKEQRGPFFLQTIPLNNQTLWFICTLLVIAVLGKVLSPVIKAECPAETSNPELPAMTASEVRV